MRSGLLVPLIIFATLALCMPCAWGCNPWINILVALCSPSRKYLWGLLLCSSCDKFNFIFLGLMACLHFLLFTIVVFFFLTFMRHPKCSCFILYWNIILHHAFWHQTVLEIEGTHLDLETFVEASWSLSSLFYESGMLLSNYFFFFHFSAGGPTPSSLRRRTQNNRNKINQSRNVDCKISKYNIHVYIVRSIIQRERGIFIKKCPWYQGSMGSKSYCLRWPTFPDIKQISVRNRNVNSTSKW